MDTKFLPGLLRQLRTANDHISPEKSGISIRDQVEQLNQERERARLLRQDIGAALEALVPDFGEGFSGDEAPDQTGKASSASQEGQEGASDDLPDPEALLALLRPRRSFSGMGAPHWEKERQEHPGHQAAHALGAVIAHTLLHGSRLIGRSLGEHHRRILAHALHGAAEHFHPGGTA